MRGLMDKICAVCKQIIDESLVVECKGFLVHPGSCYNYINEKPITESSEQELSEVQLML